jgi:hypothetical protein
MIGYVYDELERISKGAVVTFFKVLSQHSPGGTEKKNEKPQSGYPVAGDENRSWDLLNAK